MFIKTLGIIFLLCFLVPQDRDFIPLQLDALGQSEFYLNEINPYFQSTFNIGAIQLAELDHIPYASRLMNFSFIDDIDTSNVTSQFNYSRGDYAFRETEVLANNPLSNNRNLLFKAHGRKYPGIYNSLGNDYILQNYLVDYKAVYDDKVIELTKYYHEEDINLPIIEENNRRFSEIEGLGASISFLDRTSILDNKYNLIINYQNIFYNGEGYGNQGESVKLISQKNQISFNLLTDVNDIVSSNFYFAYKNFESELMSDFDASDLSEIRGTCRYMPNLYHSFDFGFHYIDFSTDIHPVFNYTFNYKQKWIFNLKRDYYFKSFNVFDVYPKDSRYHLISLKREFQKAKLGISLFLVELGDLSSGLIDEEGKLIRVDAQIGGQGQFDFKDKDAEFLDFFNLRFIFHDYLDYSPIDYNANFKISAKYLRPRDVSKYNPFLNFQINYIALNPDYSIALDSSGILFNDGEFNSIEYQTSEIEIGLIFDNFIISYNILNLGSEYYFSEQGSNINIPIYQMNYLNVKWQFQD